MLREAIHFRTKVPLEALDTIAASASKRYKVYTIPKRNGGEREISHPSRSLKAIQRWLTRNLLAKAHVHEAATAYEPGCSIRANAAKHAGTKYTLRMDFANFFPSFDRRSVEEFLRRVARERLILLTEEDISFASRIFCRHDRLTIGAPSSPKLTNAMMYDIDKAIYTYATDQNMIYTRYADDLFLSSFVANQLTTAEGVVRGIISEHTCPRLKLNDEKTLHLSMRGHRSVTGLVLTPTGQVSLGRARKRELKSLVYRALSNKLNPVERAYLSGMIAFAADAEPSFVASMTKKFETDVIQLSRSL